jgi:hypothetical protein
MGASNEAMNKRVFLGTAVAIFVAMGAASHMKSLNIKDKAVPLIIPNKCLDSVTAKEAGRCFDAKLKDSSRTSELFLRKMSRHARRFYA